MAYRDKNLQRATRRAYYLSHRDEIQAQHRRYNQTYVKPPVDKAKKAAQNRSYYLRNTERLKAKSKVWRQANKEQALAATKRWLTKHPWRTKQYRETFETRHPGRSRQHKKAWELRNKQNISERRKLRRKSDLGFALLIRLRGRLVKAIKSQATRKLATTLELVGCSREQMIKHIESQFLPGMSWERRSAWHIDHKRPCKSFDFTKIADQKACFHYTNLQPLWAKDNRIKSAKWNPVDDK